MKLQDFNNLDPRNLGNWPIPVKAVVILMLCAAGLAAGYYLDTQNQITELSTFQQKELELIEDFKKKQMDAARLPKLKEQMIEIQENLKELQSRLPNQAQVGGLITDISQQAIASSLKSELFEPQAEKMGQLYVEIPIKLELSGNYHSFGKFVSGVAAMSRIVTLHDVSIKTNDSGQKKTGQLTMNLTAKIYRYRDASEVVAAPPPAAAKPGAAPPPPPPPAKK
jgi:type IV pilus assembly protein PilO